MVNLGRNLLNSPCILPITILCALTSIIFPPGLFLASIIIILFTLEKGYSAGSKLLLGVLIPFVAIMMWQHTVPLFILFFIFRFSLNWFLAGLYHRYSSWRLIFEVLTLLGILAITIFHFNVPNVAGWWAHIINQTNIYDSVFQDPTTVLQLKQQLLNYAGMGTGIICSLVIIDCCFHLFLGLYWQKKINQTVKGEKLKFDYNQFKMGPVFAVILGLVTLGKFCGVSLAIDYLPVIIFPFIVSGLCVLHRASHEHRFFKWGMIFIYFGLALGYAWIIGLIAAIAFVFSFNLQKHFPMLSNLFIIPKFFKN